ncbi:MAG TPA: ABC transporter substrate-binding protein, partial [Burkholderiaceae bacterium]|nr:ABC transporter substrate-binding protein [Burkholderiaceae bacterium]
MIRRWMAGLLAPMFVLSTAPAAFAQQGVPLRLIVPFATGGPTDIASRVIAPLLSATMQRPVLVENKVGATGAIGTEFV